MSDAKLLLPGDHLVTPFFDATALRRDAAALRGRAEHDGYLYFSKLLDPLRVAAVRAAVRQMVRPFDWIVEDDDNPAWMAPHPAATMEGRGWDDPRFVSLQRQISAHPDFLALARDPALLDTLEVLMGEPAAVAVANHCWLKLPGSPQHTTRPHQDIFYLPECPRMWTIWVPLVDTAFPVGPLGIVPGSRHRGLWPHVHAFVGIDMPRDVPWASSEVVVGDVVLFDAHTIHCAWSNVSPDRVRLSLDIRYEPRELGRPSLLRPGAGTTDETHAAQRANPMPRTPR